ncbi:ATPase P-type K/Mg/Cd/Cu/Zn/Na/Ca/Na/H-transporter [Penicillium cf. griseofulvum]|uniref:P-type Ca(2+) transporter n=1 Tax=Penicillium cf. griseofulvum TaxID=2972120 RepID=A0A9W9MQX4_9EURO|nr:ATPase P-type K/Mg/Cd/Cu/Zn/Na/Ca/Na/H-transporter [Penicillium cf. griseofulvum]KAJ5441206.1 ATPase P-type K/Mg/Cd/Cu/Zn/Na/Ca/Na/H-transporter [Penicillium cf. griseofulvum]KAJ5449254.1 ATPase P-type K/Mg/Cd/Cu/Zn/Na/Ca/Na/H-transporter [Penicillium cf. griseofulvum]
MSRSATPSLPLHNASNIDFLQPPSTTPMTGRSNAPPSASTSTYSWLEPHETAERLRTSLLHGLTPAEAEIRLARDGPNELPHDEPEPLWLRFLKQFKEPLILLLLGSAGISFVMGNYDDAISITLAVTIVVTVGFVQEYRSEKSLEALSRLVPHYAHLIRDVPTTSSAIAENSGTPPLGPGMEMDEIRTKSPGSASAAVKASSTVPASELVPGDLVLFTTGDRIPADIRITAATHLSIDESNLTGENEPVVKYAEALRSNSGGAAPGSKRIEPPRSPFYDAPASGAVGADIRLNEQHNVAFMGTLVRSGYGQGIVISTGAKTEFGSISASLQEIESPRTPLQLSMDRLGQELSYISFGVIGLIVVIGLIQGRKILEMFTIGVSLAVAAIPEGLPIIVTVTLALGVLRMAKRGAIMRRLPSVETLGSVNVVCSDKTGTLTLNHMTVTKMWHFDCPEPFEVQREMTSVVPPGPAAQTILRVGNIANNSRLSRMHANSPASASSAAVLSSTINSDSAAAKSRWVGQPTDVAILDLMDILGEDDVRDRISARVHETPFSSERKWMGVVIGGSGASNGGSHVAYIKGALEQVLARSDTYLTKDGREVILDEPRRKIIREAAENMASDGLRVLAFGSGVVRDMSRGGRGFGSRSSPKIIQGDDDERYNGLVFAGLMGMNDPPRKDVHKSIRRLMSGGVRVIMITGDAETTAVAIAKKLGMPVSDSPHARSVIRGDELDRMTAAELAQAISTVSIFARTSPDHKMKIVTALQARGDVVAMTGDGVNDAPALKKADIGISMGKLGTDVAKEAADMILTDDDFSTILRAIEQGKGIFYNIQNFITFQLSTSVAALSLVLLSTTLGFKNPLNAMQILWINILMDGPPAQSLGVEPVDPTIMNRPPRPKTARVLTKPLIQRVLTSAMIIMVGTLSIYISEMGDITDGSPVAKRSRIVTAHDTTMTFTCFVLFDMFNALTCRSESKSVLRGEMPLFGNKMFNYAVLGSLAGQACVIYLPFLQRIFQTESLSFGSLVKLVCISSSVFWVDEARKYLHAIRRRRGMGSGYSVNV